MLIFDGTFPCITNLDVLLSLKLTSIDFTLFFIFKKTVVFSSISIFSFIFSKTILILLILSIFFSLGFNIRSYIRYTRSN